MTKMKNIQNLFLNAKLCYKNIKLSDLWRRLRRTGGWTLKQRTRSCLRSKWSNFYSSNTIEFITRTIFS